MNNNDDTILKLFPLSRFMYEVNRSLRGTFLLWILLKKVDFSNVSPVGRERNMVK